MKHFFVLFVFLPSVLLAQSEKDREPLNESYLTTDLISPFFIHFKGNYTPRWRLGYLKNLTEKSKIGIDVGYGNKNVSLINTGEKYILWKIRPEFYYIINPNRKTLKYFALEAFYIDHTEEFTTQSFFDEQNNYLRFNKADYNRKKMGLVPKFGMFINLSRSIGLNIYTGVGIRYRINTYDNFVDLRQGTINEEHFSPYFRNEGSKIGVEFTFGTKLYYRLKS